MDDRTHGAKTEAANEIILRDGTHFSGRSGKVPDVKAKPRSRLRPILLLGIAVLLGLGLYRIATAVRAPSE